MIVLNPGNMWDISPAIKLIPINLAVSGAGKLIMGTGLAGQLAKRHPEIPYLWAKIILRDEAAIPITQKMDDIFVGIPTKYRPYDRMANKRLISQSLEAFRHIAVLNQWQTSPIICPYLGCGLHTGKLIWEQDVLPIVTPIFWGLGVLQYFAKRVWIKDICYANHRDASG